MTDPASTSPTKPPPLVFKTGDVLAERYQLLQQLGSGGYSTVFAANDRQTGRELAIKILKTGGGNNDPSALPRLRQEANFLQSIDHPHVLKMFAFERHRDLAYVTMENVPGISLAHIIHREGPAPSGRVLPVVKQLLSALHAVHARKILHRDVKPENILISPGEPEACKLVDFGLAKVFTGVDIEAEELEMTLVKTKAGGFLGTPRYTPPEQALGDPVGPYTDLFSLGLVIAEWLTATVRLKGDTHAELMRNLVGPLSIDVSDCPRAWQKWLAMILAKDPARRFRTAQQALTALISEVESELSDRRAEELAMDVHQTGFFSMDEEDATSFLDEDGPLELDLERVRQLNPERDALSPQMGHSPMPPGFAPPPQQRQSLLTPPHSPHQAFSHHDDAHHLSAQRTSFSTYLLVGIIGASVAIVLVLVILLVQ